MFTQKSNMLVSEVMIPVSQAPTSERTALLKEVLEKMSVTRLGIACIIDTSHVLLGVITDGDIRRKILKIQKPLAALLVDDALEHAITTPEIIGPSDKLVDAVDLMGRKQIWDLPVVTSDNVLVGLLHLHPAVNALLKSNI